jgi:hypothetical protein
MTTEPLSKREFTRVPVHCRVEIKSAAGPIPCTCVSTISMNGMLVQTDGHVPDGTQCEITISLVEHEIEINLLGCVVRSYLDGIAFQFTSILGPESYEHLHNLVLYNAPNTEVVENEFKTHAGIRRKDL